jgi:hypothetical protein
MGAMVVDAASTCGSRHVNAEEFQQPHFDTVAAMFQQGIGEKIQQKEPVFVADGDVILNVYGCFVYFSRIQFE